MTLNTEQNNDKTKCGENINRTHNSLLGNVGQILIILNNTEEKITSPVM